MSEVYLSAFFNFFFVLGTIVFFLAGFLIMISDGELPMWVSIVLVTLVLICVFWFVCATACNPFTFSSYSKCPVCSGVVHQTDEFCSACGYDYNLHCDCGYRWIEGDVYCTECGMKR